MNFIRFFFICLDELDYSLSDQSALIESTENEMKKNKSNLNDELTWIDFTAKFSNIVKQLSDSQLIYKKCTDESIINEHILTLESLANIKEIKRACEECITVGEQLIEKHQQSEYNIQDTTLPSMETIIAYDPGLRPSYNNLSDAQRNYLISLGPHQPKLSLFPSDGKNRFNPNWYKEFCFLEYSIVNDSVFCFICYLFPSTLPSEFTEVAWYSKGVKNWGKMKSSGKKKLGKLPQHFSSQGHKSALQKYCGFINKKQHISTFLNKNVRNLLLQEEQIMQFNRKIIRILFDTTLTLSRQGLAFRGGDNDESGNFFQIVRLISKYNPVLNEWLQDTKMRPYQVTYLSHQSQNEFISLLAGELKKKIIAEIETSCFFAVLADTTPDYSHTERLSVVIRTVDSSCKPKERLLEIFEPTGKTGNHIAMDILACLNRNGININGLCFQSYDFASVMSGQYNGVQQKISEIIEHSVPYIPCQDHRINTAVEHCCNSSVLIRELFNYLEELFVFFTSSTKKNRILKETLSDIENKLNLKNLSKTRWTSRADSIKAVLSSYEKILDVLEEISINNVFDKVSKTKSLGLRKKILNFDFIVSLYFMKNVMYKIKILIEVIESPNLNIIDCKNLMETTTGLLKKMMDDSSDIDNLISAAKEMASNIGIDAAADFRKYHRRRLAPKRLDPNNETEIDVDMFTFYRKEFRTVMDTLLSKLHLYIENISTTLLPIFNVFNFPLKPEKLKLEDIEGLLQMIPPKLPRPDKHDLYSELGILFGACSEASSLQDVIETLLSKFHMLPQARYIIQFVVTASYVTASNERSFSQMKIIKNLLRTTMVDDRLNDLMLLKCEKELTDSLDYSVLLNSWAKLKERRIKV